MPDQAKACSPPFRDYCFALSYLCLYRKALYLEIWLHCILHWNNPRLSLPMPYARLEVANSQLIKRVVPELSRVVENAALFWTSCRLNYDFLECLSMQISAFNKLVQVRHVSLVVLSVVEIQSPRTDVRFEILFLVREFWECKGHLYLLSTSWTWSM
jgi:hypothetical protein